MHNYSEEEYLQLSGVQHFVFCKRQWALLNLEQTWLENYLTSEGRFFHETAHNAIKTESRGDVLITRGLPICSRVLGLSGICDVVEFHKSPDGIKLFGRKDLYKVIPIEYKRGREKAGDEDILQVVAQSVCLEEMLLTEITKAYLFYGSSKRRYEIEVDLAKKQKLTQIVSQMHVMWRSQITPKAKYEKKCDACSLLEVCLPKYTNKPKSTEEYMNGFLEL